jgi:hypothetical protein
MVIGHIDTQLNQARSKLIQIFRYVQAFNYLQNPIPQDIQEQLWVFWLGSGKTGYAVLE